MKLQQSAGVEEMLYQIPSAKPIEEIERNLQESAVRRRFGVIVIHDLQETLRKKDVDLDITCRIYEVCNPQQAKTVLEADGSVSTALPCRISVYGSPGHYTLATLRPTAMMKAFANPVIERVAWEVEDAILQMMRDAAGIGV